MSQTVTPTAPSQAYPNILAPDRAARWVTLVLRLAVAYLWFNNLEWKVPPDFGQADRSGLWVFTHGAIEHPVLPAYSSLVESLIIPNFVPFAWGVFLAEIALTVFLALGLFTRGWALIGAAQSFVIFLTVGAQPHEWRWSYFLIIIAHLALFALAAGRFAGLDAWLRRRARGLQRRPGGVLRLLLLGT